VVCGSSFDDTTLFLTVVNGESAYFYFSNVELKYRAMMNIIVLVRGGTVSFDNVKIDKQRDYHWVNPLIDVNATTSRVDVYILSTSITNSMYHHANTSTSLYKSGVVFFDNTSTNIISLHMQGSSFLNDSFYLTDGGYSASRGSVCRFNGPAQSGLFSFIYTFVLGFEFIFI
jgi:hypothetical protein